jgi:DNA repair protein RecO (recombination protein O)
MPSFETESLVLRSYGLSEADRIVVFLTRDHGIVRGVARGAKRLKSRFGSTLEPFSTVNLSFFQKDERELVSIQQVDLTRSRFAAASDPSYLETFSYLAELLIAFLPPHDPNVKTFRLASACFDLNPADDGQFAAARLYFEIWVLRLGGLLPEWAICADCGTALSFDRKSWLRTDVHLICDNCLGPRRLPAVAAQHRRVYQWSGSSSPADFIAEVGPDKEVVEEISGLMRRLINQAVGRDLYAARAAASRP